MVPVTTIDAIKSHWQMILGADKSGQGAICPACGSGSGENGTGLTQVPGSYELKCFACGQSHDVFAWYALKHNLDNERDFKRIVEECSAITGISIDVQPRADRKAQKVKTKSNTAVIDFSKYYNECTRRLKDTDYWLKRGLSLETCRYFRVGFDPDWKHFDWSDKVTRSPRLIIPVNRHCYLARDTRADFLKTLDKDARKQCWNAPKVKVNGQKPAKFPIFHRIILDRYFTIICVEGEIDAMSIYDVGFKNVIALGSIAYTKLLVDELKALQVKPKSIIVALDNENSANVIKAKEKLAVDLNKLGINFIDGSSISGEYKDANELLIADRAALKSNVQSLVDRAESLPPIRIDIPTVKDSKSVKDSKDDKLEVTTDVPWTFTANKIFGAAPVDIRIPDKYTVDKQGIVGNNIVCTHTPVIPVGRIINHHTREQQFVLALYRPDGSWTDITAPASTIYEHHKILSLTDQGLSTCSGVEAKTLVNYFFDTIAINHDLMFTREAFDQPGWSSDMQEFRLPNRNDCFMPNLAESLIEKGTLDVWLDKAREVRKANVARFMLAAAFAAPLLRILDMRSFGLYLHGNSKGGKSACQKFALSVWGNPKKMMSTFNATLNGLEAACIKSNDLPMLIDEATQADQKLDPSKLQYVIGDEVNRTRMDKNMNQRPVKNWRLIALMNGEHSIFDDSSKEGAMTRTLDVSLRPHERIFADENIAAAVHAFVERNHGVVGRAWLDILFKHADNDFEFIRDLYKEGYDLLKEYAARYTTEYVRIMTALMLADALTTHFLFEENMRVDLLGSKVELIDDAIKRIPTNEQLSEERRAWGYFIDKIVEYKQNFFGEHLEGDPSDMDAAEMKLRSNLFGEWMYDRAHRMTEVIMSKTAAQELLSKGKFNANKMLRAFASRKWIETDANGNYPIRHWQGLAAGQRQRAIVIKSDNFTTDP